MSDIPSEEDIHQLYDAMQKDKTDRKAIFFERRLISENPDPLMGRQPLVTNISRNNLPSFRSDYFNIGEGLQVLASGETKILAKKTVPAQYGGVLTGFSQFFSGCDANPEIAQSITWGLRIDGLVTQGFADFVGEFSTLMIPHAIYFPLVGGASTLGESDLSPGGTILGEENIPTVLFKATNNNPFSVILQGRLVGYTFPVAERNDEFQSF